MWTAAERRGAALIVLLLVLGAGRDLWRASHPVMAPPVPGPGSRGTGPEPGTGPIPDTTGSRADPSPVRALDLNRATAGELEALPGIGPVLAGRIVEHRRVHGAFRSPDELLAVRGIGPRLLDRLRARVRTDSLP